MKPDLQNPRQGQLPRQFSSSRSANQCESRNPHQATHTAAHHRNESPQGSMASMEFDGPPDATNPQKRPLSYPTAMEIDTPQEQSQSPHKVPLVAPKSSDIFSNVPRSSTWGSSNYHAEKEADHGKNNTGHNSSNSFISDSHIGRQPTSEETNMNGTRKQLEYMDSVRQTPDARGGQRDTLRTSLFLER